MWPTFVIPGSGTLIPVGDCFNQYTKLVSTNRSAGNGFVIDPELQFATQANKAYWIYGRLDFEEINGAGPPGVSYNFIHSGDTTSFANFGSGSTQFTASTSGSGKVESIPYLAMNTYGYGRRSSVSLNAPYSAFVDAIISVGASAGVFGVVWGINPATAGSTSLMAGSYITAIEVSNP